MKNLSAIGVSSLLCLLASFAYADVPPPNFCSNLGAACDTAGNPTTLGTGDQPGTCVLVPSCPNVCRMQGVCTLDGGCYLDAGSPTALECVQLPDAGRSGTTTGTSSSSSSTSGSNGTSGSSSTTSGSGGGSNNSSRGCSQPGPAFGPWMIALSVPLLLLRRRRRA